MKPKKVQVDGLRGDQVLPNDPVVLRIGPELLRVAVLWEGQQIEQDLNADVTFENDPEGLNRALGDQVSRSAWWGMLHSRAKHASAVAERDLKVKRAEVLIQSKLKAGAATVDILKAMVDVDPEVEALERRLIEAEAEVQATATGRDALRERKDVLMTVASNMRQEMEQGLRVLTPEARKRAETYRRSRGQSAQVPPE
jgi:hypothetical protein